MTAALDCNLVRDPEPEPSSQVAPKFLAYRYHKRYKCPEARQCLAHQETKGWSRIRGERER